MRKDKSARVIMASIVVTLAYFAAEAILSLPYIW